MILTRTVYLNGSWFAEADAKVPSSTEAFLFADAIYEVTGVVGGKGCWLNMPATRLRASALG